MTEVRLPEFSVHSTPPDGVWPRMKITNFDTWYSGGSFRSEAVESPQRDGNFDPGDVQISAKTFTLEGLLESRTHEDLVARDFDLLNSLQGSRSRWPLHVIDAGGDRYRTVVVDGIVDVETFHARKARFKIPFRADDPFKYGELVSRSAMIPNDVGVGLMFPLFSTKVAPAGKLDFGSIGRDGRVALPNTGNETAWPVFKVRGPAPNGFTITNVNEGRILRYSAPVLGGQSIWINTDTGRAEVDGIADVTRSLTRYEWSGIPRGGSATFQLDAVGADMNVTLLTAETRPTWR